MQTGFFFFFVMVPAPFYGAFGLFFPCLLIQVESGWGVPLHTPDRRVDLCLHSGHPPRPQLPPGSSSLQLSSRTGVRTQSS